MSSQIEELEPISIGKGCVMHFYVDNTVESEYDINKQWTETTYDGEPDSWVVAVPGHWHKEHEEVMEMLEGRMTFTLDGKATILGVGDTPLKIPRYAVHGFSAFKGEKCRLKESTDPSGNFKELFFRDLFQAGTPGFWHVVRCFYDGDSFLALPGGFKMLDQIFTTTIGAIATLFTPPKPVKEA